MVIAWMATRKAHIAQSRLYFSWMGVTFHVASCGISNWVLLNVIYIKSNGPFSIAALSHKQIFFSCLMCVCVCCSVIPEYWSSGVEQPDDKVFDERNTICIEQIVMKYKSNSFGKSNVYTFGELKLARGNGKKKWCRIYINVCVCSLRNILIRGEMKMRSSVFWCRAGTNEIIKKLPNDFLFLCSSKATVGIDVSFHAFTVWWTHYSLS